MNPVPNPDFMEVRAMQHACHAKQQCFVFTEIADIELPPEITKLTNEKYKNSGITTCKEQCGDMLVDHTRTTSRCRKVVIVLGLVLVCFAMAGGIPLALQLRSSSLLEARLSFIRRLLTETPLIEGVWKPTKRDNNYNASVFEARQNNVGALLWPIAVPCGAQYLDAVQLALEGIDEAKRMTAHTDSMHIAESADEMEQIHIRGDVAVLMGIGGGHALGASLAVLRSMYLLGVRFVSITSLECTTPWAAAAIKTRDFLMEENATNSLNEFGKMVLYEMNRLGMLVEISQLSEAGMVTALRTAKAPVLFINSTPLSLCNSTNVASIPDHILR
ncbi:dipeptidase 3-like [Teleopsis dalmanni]|uniref:dipeptidase 3-like n=1 Tax=Teleopsis dalmanni TaxID=139649 RepID=UPI0018CD46B5|nr:dipeptidase 3-like [Teleopsis dalmanni]